MMKTIGLRYEAQKKAVPDKSLQEIIDSQVKQIHSPWKEKKQMTSQSNSEECDYLVLVAKAKKKKIT